MHTSPTSKETEIRHLEESLGDAIRIDENRLAGEIKAIGFKCRRCAQCCREEYGDNTVFIFPFEIRRMCKKTGLKREDFIMPAPSLDVDREGNNHTFEWVLLKSDDCIFLKGGLCQVYECRPYLCKTYPFYLINGDLMFSECGGLGGKISDEESHELARVLKDRYVTEIRETISLLERFHGFKPQGMGKVCVHDSEGEHWL